MQVIEEILESSWRRVAFTPFPVHGFRDGGFWLMATINEIWARVWHEIGDRGNEGSSINEPFIGTNDTDATGIFSESLSPGFGVCERIIAFSGQLWRCLGT